MAKYRITEKGVHHGKGNEELKVGTTFTLADGEPVPPSLINKCICLDAVDEGEDVGAALGNDSAAERQALLARIASEELEDEDFTNTGLPKLSEINELLDDDVEPFTQVERDQLWPGIADQVAAARNE